MVKNLHLRQCESVRWQENHPEITQNRKAAVPRETEHGQLSGHFFLTLGWVSNTSLGVKFEGNWTFSFGSWTCFTSERSGKKEAVQFWQKVFSLSSSLGRWNTKKWKQETPSCWRCSSRERVSSAWPKFRASCLFQTKPNQMNNWCGLSDVSSLSHSVKDKAEILLQVEELLHIKEELSSQVCYSEIKIVLCCFFCTFMCIFCFFFR